MDIVLNGQAHRVSEGATVAMLLQQLVIDPRRVAVEVNVAIVKRKDYETTALQVGDQVEIVHLVGGGAEKADTRCKLQDAS